MIGGTAERLIFAYDLSKNRLYILYPADKIRINQTVEKITDEDISKYLFAIIWPIKNVIKLIDDVRL